MEAKSSVYYELFYNYTDVDEQPVLTPKGKPEDVLLNLCVLCKHTPAEMSVGPAPKLSIQRFLEIKGEDKLRLRTGSGLVHLHSE